MITELEKSIVDIQKMAEQNEKLIYMVLKDMKLWDKKDDYYGYGAIGLMNGCKKFNSDLGFKESTFLYRCIRNRILMQLRKEKGKKVIQNYISLDCEYENDEDSSISLMDTIASDFDLEQNVVHSFTMDKIRIVMNQVLKQNEKFAIDYYFGLNGIYQHKQSEIAELLNINQSAVARLVRRGLNKIRKELKNELYI